MGTSGDDLRLER